MEPIPLAKIKATFRLVTGRDWTDEYTTVLLPIAESQVATDGIRAEYTALGISYLVAHYIAVAGAGNPSGAVIASESVGSASRSYAFAAVAANALDGWMARYNELLRMSANYTAYPVGSVCGMVNPIYSRDSSRHPAPGNLNWCGRREDIDLG